MGTFISSFKDAHEELLKAIHLDEFLLLFTQSEKRSNLLDAFLKEMSLFYRSVNWSEPFFYYLAAFHTMILLVILNVTVLRPCSVERLFVCSIFLLALAFSAVPLNRIGQKYGELLFRTSRVNYFDESGAFLAILYWAPLMIEVVWIELCIIARVCMEIVRLNQQHITSQARNTAQSNEVKSKNIQKS
ncbi:unnamed protein product [Phytomonas sp. EM1]|nr:unnamed protein product [Phytomonas sp. EM1]|eukprot:CCW60289.1 unnamed protein product [Phytomonas sp. isolate EM1]